MCRGANVRAWEEVGRGCCLLARQLIEGKESPLAGRVRGDGGKNIFSSRSPRSVDNRHIRARRVSSSEPYPPRLGSMEAKSSRDSLRARGFYSVARIYILLHTTGA